jgi:membrane protein implicated in regulation of membrane protease activity
MYGESYIPSMFWADTILLFAGLFVIALAFFLSQRLGAPVSFNFSKLGLDFKADRLTFVLVVGLLLIAVGVFFRYRNYENKYQEYENITKSLKTEVSKNQETLVRIENTINKSSGYNLDIEVVFPKDVKKAEIKNLKIVVSTEKKGESRKERKIEPQYIESENKFEFQILGLLGDEIVRVFALDKNNPDIIHWMSDDITILEERKVEMKKYEE